MDRIRRLVDAIQRSVEQLLPWFDPRAEAAKDRRVAAQVGRVDEVAERVRIGSRVIRDRVAVRR